MTALAWTAARRRGFEVLAAQHTRARRSNETDPVAGYVYWQTADWLIGEGLAEMFSSSTDHIALTSVGRQAASEMGLR